MNLSLRTLAPLMTILGLSLFCSQNAKAEAKTVTADVVIYGATSGGITAAIQVAKSGKTVLIIEPSVHLGGLTSGGLGWTDSGRKEVIGGLSREFYQRLKKHYDQPSAWRQQKPEQYSRYRKDDDAMWVFEPHIAEKTYRQWLAEYAIPVYFNERLNRETGVAKTKGSISAITMESGLKAEGQIFIDATYEGDLMATAGVSYFVGREANSKYGETLNGIQKAHTVKHQFEAKVSPYVVAGDPSSGLLPGVHGEDPGEDGDGDHRIQAYCFRMCLTNDPSNRVEFIKPEGYDPQRYELLARYLETGWDHVFRKFDPAPNRKTDTNNHGAISTDNIGMNYDFPEASYAEREAIIAEHRTYQQGWLWFLANDPRVPEDIQKKMQTWGLAKDEFLDNDHWPHQLYIREARRMVGAFVMTENELKGKKVTPKPIGMGSYNMDSHNCQRYVTPEGYARNEGDIQVNPGGPYPISYDSITPQKQECTNLLVPVCVSSSHIAYGSIRMEPVFMVLGQSAANAAVMAIDQSIPVQDVDYSQLETKLLEQGQVLKWNGVRSIDKSVDTTSLKGIIIDNHQAKFEGSWQVSGATPGFVGGDYMHNMNKTNLPTTATFTTDVPAAGEYRVLVSYSANANRCPKVPVTIVSGSNKWTGTVNQTRKPTRAKAFAEVTTITVNEGASVSVTISNSKTEGYVIADAVWLEPIE